MTRELFLALAFIASAVPAIAQKPGPIKIPGLEPAQTYACSSVMAPGVPLSPAAVTPKAVSIAFRSVWPIATGVPASMVPVPT